ncbi:MAG TPA: tRNA epoxyqueuosine(34) reductase QueG [Thermoanaerobaculia bacterium]|nr:tRNA epoxyqueuosine(34) reductase QueG [Thermoanaerobaculia bacterium]
MPTLASIWRDIETAAKERGVLRIGASGIDDEHVALFEEWLRRGGEASMAYLRKNLPTRLDPLHRFPWARSVVAITVPYSAHRPPAPATALSSVVARYALGDDYHTVLDAILEGIEETILRLVPHAKTRRYVDTGPLSDRSYAAQAGLGWIGRNAMLIDPDHGSYFVIGLLLTSLPRGPEAEEITDRCGSCTACIDACPTGAILADRAVASDRCISHATIEQRGAIDDRMKNRLTGNLFGCDICQDVCPWNRAAPPAHPSLEPREIYRATPISDLLRMDQTDFSRMFRASAIKRARRAGLVRNALLLLEAATSPPPDLEQDEGVADAKRWRACSSP